MTDRLDAIYIFTESLLAVSVEPAPRLSEHDHVRKVQRMIISENNVNVMDKSLCLNSFTGALLSWIDSHTECNLQDFENYLRHTKCNSFLIAKATT